MHTGTKRVMVAGGLAAMVIAVMGQAAQPPAERPADKGASREPGDVVSISKSMPEIKRESGVVTMPLTSKGALAWRGIRDGITVEGIRADAGAKAGAGGGEQLKVSYTRTRGKAAGAALVFRPGTLAGLEKLEVKMKGTRAQRLSICLKDTAGVVWTFPSVNLRGEEITEQTLKVEEIEPDAYQNQGKVEAKFDPATVMMVTVIDIAGYMSATEPECGWTIEGMKGVCK
jgi:hypothetical protein